MEEAESKKEELFKEVTVMLIKEVTVTLFKEVTVMLIKEVTITLFKEDIATSPKDIATSPKDIATSPKDIATSPKDIAMFNMAVPTYMLTVINLMSESPTTEILMYMLTPLALIIMKVEALLESQSENLKREENQNLLILILFLMEKTSLLKKDKEKGEKWDLIKENPTKLTLKKEKDTS